MCQISGHQNDLAADTTRLAQPVGFLDLRQLQDLRDRDLELAVRHSLRQFAEPFRIRSDHHLFGVDIEILHFFGDPNHGGKDSSTSEVLQQADSDTAADRVGDGVDIFKEFEGGFVVDGYQAQGA